MRCAGCARGVERTASALACVAAARVNFAAAVLEVEWQPDAPPDRVEILKKAVADAGFALGEFRLRDPAGELAARARRDLLNFLAAFAAVLAAVLLPRIAGWGDDSAAMKIVPPAMAAAALLAGRDFFLKGIPAFFRRRPDMDTLIAFGAGAAAIAGALKLFSGETGCRYFDMTGMIISLVLLGHALESRARRRTFDAVNALQRLTPPVARRLDADGRETEIPADELRPGDRCAVLPGDRFPADGEVVDGDSAVDESMLTGESLPVEKHPGSRVVGGSINRSGRLICRVTASGEETVLAGMIAMVEEAQADRPPVANLADRAAGYFVSAVLLIAVAVFGIWFCISGFDMALERALAVLVVACPCALGLATPAALIVGIGRGAGMGILFKSGTALETASRTDTAVFDKTGTLTLGAPEITAITPAAIPEEELLALAAGMEAHSSHPLAAAIRAKTEAAGVRPVRFSRVETVPGGGLQGTAPDGTPVIMGSRRFLAGAGLPELPESSAPGMVVGVAAGGRIAGMMVFADRVRPGARQALAELREMGIRPVIATGDNPASAAEAARILGVEDFRPALAPGEKELLLREIREKGGRPAMIGDGINDAPALAAADVGVAVGTGADAARAAADVVLTSGDPAAVPVMFALARKVMRVIRENLFWAFFYNIIGIPAAAGVLIPFGVAGMHPAVCAGCMAVSSLTVVGNALRLRWTGLPERPASEG